jgi:hypothetical protein
VALPMDVARWTVEDTAVAIIGGGVLFLLASLISVEEPGSSWKVFNRLVGFSLMTLGVGCLVLSRYGV